MKDTYLEYLGEIYSLFQNYLIIFQMLHKNTTTLDQGCEGGELHMPDSVTFNNKTYTVVSFTEYRFV